MSSLNVGFEPTEIVETIEFDRSYPKLAIISHLTRQPISTCYRDDNPSSKTLVECDELLVLKEFYGLLPLGPSDNESFWGQNFIESQARRNTDTRVEPQHRRLNRDEIRAIRKKSNESMGSPKGRRHKAKGER